MCYFIENYPDMAKLSHQRAQLCNAKYQYPFFCASLALTKIVLDRLRDGSIDKQYEGEDSFRVLACKMHVILFKKLHDLW